MRLSTQQLFQQGSSSISDLNSQTARLQEQISSGKRILSASDDPASASRIIRLESQLSRIGQYNKNIDLADSSLVRTEQSLASIQGVIEDIRVKVLEAGGPATDRDIIAVELEELLKQLVDLTNDSDEQGNFIFAGFQTDRAAYAESPGGQFVFQGNGGVSRVQIDNNSYVTKSETGLDIFENIALFNSQIETTPAPGNSAGFQLISSTIDDRTQFDTVFPEDYLVQFQPETSVVPNGPNYSVTRVSDGATIVANAVYQESVGINFEGIRLTAAGPPQPGDSLSVSSVTEQNMLNIVEGIKDEIAGLDSSTSELSDFLGSSLDNIDAIRDNLDAARVRVGVNLSRLDDTKNTLADRELTQQSLLSDIRDLDYAEAISQLSFLTFVLEASQASFARISNLSLFNFIR